MNPVAIASHLTNSLLDIVKHSTAFGLDYNPCCADNSQLIDLSSYFPAFTLIN